MTQTPQEIRERHAAIRSHAGSQWVKWYNEDVRVLLDQLEAAQGEIADLKAKVPDNLLTLLATQAADLADATKTNELLENEVSYVRDIEAQRDTALAQVEKLREALEHLVGDGLEHRKRASQYCQACGLTWPCPQARGAEALRATEPGSEEG